MSDHTPQQESLDTQITKADELFRIAAGDYYDGIPLVRILVNQAISLERIRLLDEVRGLVEGMRKNKGKLGKPNPELFSEVIKWPFWDDSCKKEANEMWQTAVAARIVVEHNNALDDLLKALDTLGEQK